jgi:hypothetical protein
MLQAVKISVKPFNGKKAKFFKFFRYAESKDIFDRKIEKQQNENPYIFVQRP